MATPVCRARGYTYLGLMFIVAVLAATAAMASVVWSTAQRRENERQLLFAGDQFVAALERRRLRPGSDGSFPRKLEDLLGDTLRRDLRQIYVDPMTGSREWGLVKRASGDIVGVYSLSNAVPVGQQRFPGAKSYREWRFVASSAGDLDAGAALPAGAASAPPAAFASQPASRPRRAGPTAG